MRKWGAGGGWGPGRGQEPPRGPHPAGISAAHSGRSLGSLEGSLKKSKTNKKLRLSLLNRWAWLCVCAPVGGGGGGGWKSGPQVASRGGRHGGAPNRLVTQLSRSGCCSRVVLHAGLRKCAQRHSCHCYIGWVRPHEIATLQVKYGKLPAVCYDPTQHY